MWQEELRDLALELIADKKASSENIVLGHSQSVLDSGPLNRLNMMLVRIIQSTQKGGCFLPPKTIAD